ncbi:unnamed protein product [Phytophthora lilii]|uniref:Unnamed protein product n=1 Tax=Phytophthora lilii TaxID=2077276 RepID=A0A9W6XI70_9STRA|nr:unnamed protein product [Phytophthora lilii]
MGCQLAHPDRAVKVMADDVNSAYRNACIHSGSVHLFTGHIPEDGVIIIDMSAGFGWTGSSGTYNILGGVVAFVHGPACDVTDPAGSLTTTR